LLLAYGGAIVETGLKSNRAFGGSLRKTEVLHSKEKMQCRRESDAPRIQVKQSLVIRVRGRRDNRVKRAERDPIPDRKTAACCGGHSFTPERGKMDELRAGSGRLCGGRRAAMKGGKALVPL